MVALNEAYAFITIHPNEPSEHPKNVTSKLGIPYMEFFFDTTRAVFNMLEKGIFIAIQIYNG